ncbi:uncharacterized protein K460DRAFT_365245 [Cucurbitaria berberidis CBS 394.84]|uniref:Uncharacterized protein n=1 Tax=Cucurbitaria berberidis CBS 394.84 TaxID=1168544 RepID=A0A9P4GMW2_9PLEO|nr:uncharacterized protein K460DRAFT_365245 [Cucurbitaria berberidis CBS 394.84]KAF1849363.1 hypothetical protein K460DRAFT_365245 [Cucurbitaria berberidis CBS 394.84]
MIFRIAPLIAALFLFSQAIAEIAPEITTVAEGFNFIAKLPCLGCPFLYQDTSKGKDEPWTERKHENALLLNISLPYDSAHLSINNAPLLTSSNFLPRIYANQVLLDTSTEDVQSLISTNKLDDLGGAYFGLSYSYSLRRIKDSKALLFHFDIMELWSDLPESPITVILEDSRQKVLEVVLLQRPLLSAGDTGSGMEIIRAELVARPEFDDARKTRKSMWFHDWDAHGKKGTTSHMLNSASDSVTTYISSGIWALLLFSLAVIAFIIVICLFCIFGFGWHKDEYERAQHRKRRSSARESGTWGGNDVEKARKFRSAEELGLRSGARVVGVGKAD